MKKAITKRDLAMLVVAALCIILLCVFIAISITDKEEIINEDTLTDSAKMYLTKSDRSPIEFKYSKDTLEHGYILVKCNQKYINSEDYLLVVGIQISENEKKPILYDFDLKGCTDWTRCTLPYNNFIMEVRKIKKDEYINFITEPWEYKYILMKRIVISTENTSDVDIENFLERNTWFMWKNSRLIEEKAAELKEISSTTEELVNNIANWIHDNIEYSTDLADQVINDKYYNDLLDVGKTIESGEGICSNFAALMTVMLRSQGVPCKYIGGERAGSSYGHAWNAYYDNGEWINLDIIFGLRGELKNYTAKYEK